MILFAEKSEFSRHILFWWLLAPLIALLILPGVMSPVSFQIEQAEVRFLSHWGGQDREVTRRADAKFDLWFVAPGWVDRSVAVTRPQRVGGSSLAGGVSSFPAGTGSWLRDWVAGFWMLVYRILWRVLALGPLYLTAAIGFVLPAFVDGIGSRLKKRYDFGQHNPIFFYASMHFVLLAVGLAMFVPVTPLTLTPTVLGGFFLATAAAIWVTAANLQTGA
ncbi:DUF4400 domain-containing protein [Cupriavidus sp. CuC1]|uniref:DUF4400 domain-containing protein n=1 Tax=Cupriavidus sp. CuC1 TaxID=3373131 RepID=UPI0037D94EE2